MRSWPERTRRTARIEIIPMIDVMMFLLVFFVLISLNVLPSLGLHVALPGSRAPDRVTPPRRVTVTLAADGRVDVDGAPVDIGLLAATLSDRRARDPGLQVIIAGDGGAKLQQVVDVLDALKQAGVPAASVMTKQK